MRRRPVGHRRRLGGGGRWGVLDFSHRSCGGRACRLRCGSDNHIRACTPDRVPELTCALGPDSAGAVLTAALTRVTASIDAAVYEVGPSYRWAFVDAARRGTRV